jgi:hypothetical protein
VLINLGANGISNLESGVTIHALEENQWIIQGNNVHQGNIQAFDYSGKALDLKVLDVTSDFITFSLPTSFAFIRLNGQYLRLPMRG